MKRKNISELVVWLILGLISILLYAIYPLKISLIFTGILIVVHALIYFNIHGGKSLSPSSIFLLFSALLYGFPSIFSNYVKGYTILSGHYLASLLLYLSQIIIYHILLYQNSRSDYSFQSKEVKKLTSKNRVIYYILVLISFGLVNLIPIFSGLRAAITYTFILIMTTTIIIRNEQIKSSHLIAIALLYFYYIFNYFAGFGRINLVTLILSIFLIIQLRVTFKGTKPLITVLFFPLIILGSLLRGGSLDNIFGGIGSIVSPYYRLGQLVELYMNNYISPSFGKTFIAAFLVFIPRNIWKNKPWSFNREITKIFAPQYVAYGHSEVATVLGEFIYNFGFVGIILYILTIGFFVSYLDKTVVKSVTNRNWNFTNVIIYSAVSLTTAGLLNLIWGSVPTFINRDGFRILYLFVIYMIMKFINKLKKIK